MRYTIRRASSEADLKHVLKLHARFFPDVMLDGTEHWLVWAKGKPAGFASARKSIHKGYAFFTRAAIVPEHRGHNLQARLLSARLSWAKEAGHKGVLTYAANWNSASLINLLKNGFTPYSPGRMVKRRWVANRSDDFTYMSYSFKRMKKGRYPAASARP